MAKIPNWSKVSKNRQKWEDYNRNLGSDAYEGGVDVVVYEHDHGDIDVVLFKDPTAGYGISLNGSDQNRADFDTVGFRLQEHNSKKKALEDLRAQLRQNSEVMGILGESESERYQVHSVSISTYRTVGMGAPSYAKDRAREIADRLEQEYDVRTAVGDVEGRTTRKNTQGGNYGGEVPVYADRNLSHSQVERVLQN